MQSQTLIVFAILIERMAVILSAFACVYFGWNLFCRSIFIGQDGNLSLGQWKVELKQVGPGIFFSLFGAAVLGAAFVYPMTFATDGKGALQARGFLPTEEAEQMRFIRAINTVGQIKEAISGKSSSEPTVVLLRVQANDLIQAATRLEELRDQMVVAKFGSAALARWKQNREILRDNPNSLPPDVRKEIQLIDPWMTTNISADR